MVSFKGEQVTQSKCPLEKKQEDILHKSSQIFSICTMIIFSRPKKKKNGHMVRQVQVDYGDKRTHYLNSELS